MMDLIIYHNNCPDGWAAAYICKMKYPEAELMPLNHGLDPLALTMLFEAAKGKDVIMVDYSLQTRELNDQLNSLTKSFRILDHHKTAQTALEGADYATFDMKRSGAGLAWDYLFGKNKPWDSPNGPWNMEFRPWWVDYTEDQDLWNWALNHSDIINAFLMVQSRDVETWNRITSLPFKNIESLGRGVRQYIEYYTKSVVAERQEGILKFQTGVLESEDETITIPTYADYSVAVLNIPYAGVSEAGAALVELGYDIGLAWFERHDGQIQFSLRSKKGGPVDVSAIAKSYGGGGHQSAAGFQVSVVRGRLIIDSILMRDRVIQSFGGCIK